MVLHGHADPVLLDTYDAERVAIGQALLASTGEVMNTAMVDTGTEATTEATHGSDHGFMRQLIRSMSGLAIAYPDSPLTVPGEEGGGETGEGPRAGQRLTQTSAAAAHTPGWTALRAALRSPAWHLLRFASDSAPSHIAPDWVETIIISKHRPADDHGVWDPDGRVHDTLAASAGDWLLVRPDGYLSARGADDAGLHVALSRLPGLRRTEPARA